MNDSTVPTSYVVTAESDEELNAFLAEARARVRDQDCENFDEVRAAYGIDLDADIILIEPQPGIRIQRIRPGHGTRRASRPSGTRQRGSRRQSRSSSSSSGGGDPPDGESDESDDADGPLCVSETTERVCLALNCEVVFVPENKRGPKPEHCSKACQKQDERDRAEWAALLRAVDAEPEPRPDRRFTARQVENLVAAALRDPIYEQDAKKAVRAWRSYGPDPKILKVMRYDGLNEQRPLGREWRDTRPRGFSTEVKVYRGNPFEPSGKVNVLPAGAFDLEKAA